MPVETPSLFSQVIQDHLELKQKNASLEQKMPLGNYKSEDPFDNHPLFKTEEQARIEETMDGVVDPDFSDETLEDIGLGVWPGQPAPEAVAPEPEVEDATAESVVPEVEETSGFWNTGGARDF